MQWPKFGLLKLTTLKRALSGLAPRLVVLLRSMLELGRLGRGRLLGGMV